MGPAYCGWCHRRARGPGSWRPLSTLERCWYWVHIRRLKKQRLQWPWQAYLEDVRQAHSCCFFFRSLYSGPFAVPFRIVFCSWPMFSGNIPRATQRGVTLRGFSVQSNWQSPPAAITPGPQWFQNANSSIWPGLRTASSELGYWVTQTYPAFSTLPPQVDYAGYGTSLLHF